jgi:tRNA-Thr(GGU) m(6)t(6)A37 methyltransferase TsaA
MVMIRKTGAGMKEGSWRDELILRPVGFVRSPLRTSLTGSEKGYLTAPEQAAQIRRRIKQVEDVVSELVIAPELEGLLDDIEESSHIVVLYWPHLIAEEHRGLTHVHPMGLRDVPEKGIFATRSPARPNPVLVSTVELLEHKGNILIVKALEAADGSPIIDIKPYVEIYPEVANPRFPEWLRRVIKEA